MTARAFMPSHLLPTRCFSTESHLIPLAGWLDSGWHLDGEFRLGGWQCYY